MKRRDFLTSSAALPLAGLGSEAKASDPDFVVYNGEKLKVVKFRYPTSIANVEELFEGVPWTNRDSLPDQWFRSENYRSQEVDVWLPESYPIQGDSLGRGEYQILYGPIKLIRSNDRREIILRNTKETLVKKVSDLFNVFQYITELE